MAVYLLIVFTLSSTAYAGRWIPAENMQKERTGHRAFLLNDGRIFLTPVCDGGILYNAELYQPKTDSWSLASNSSPYSCSRPTILLRDGRVFILSRTHLNGLWGYAAETYDPRSNFWSATVTEPLTGGSSVMTTLQDGRVLFIGGNNMGVDNIATREFFAELYDPTTNSWTRAGNLNFSDVIVNYELIYHTSTLLKNGTVLVTGGTQNSYSFNVPDQGRRDAWLYNPATDSWSKAASMTERRFGHTATLLKDGRVLVAGGTIRTGIQDGNGGWLPAEMSDTAEIYNPLTDTWTSARKMSVPRDGHTATLLNGGRVLVAGGSTGESTQTSTAELYDPVTNSWSTAPSMPVNRSGHASTLFSKGRVLVTGGTSLSPGGKVLLKNALIYDNQLNLSMPQIEWLLLKDSPK